MNKYKRNDHSNKFMTRLFALVASTVALAGTGVAVTGVVISRGEASTLGLGMIGLSAVLGLIAILASGRSGEATIKIGPRGVDVSTAVNELIKTNSRTTRKNLTERSPAADSEN